MKTSSRTSWHKKRSARAPSHDGLGWTRMDRETFATDWRLRRPSEVDQRTSRETCGTLVTPELCREDEHSRLTRSSSPHPRRSTRSRSPTRRRCGCSAGGAPHADARLLSAVPVARASPPAPRSSRLELEPSPRDRSHRCGHACSVLAEAPEPQPEPVELHLRRSQGVLRLQSDVSLRLVVLAVAALRRVVAACETRARRSAASRAAHAGARSAAGSSPDPSLLEAAADLALRAALGTASRTDTRTAAAPSQTLRASQSRTELPLPART